MSEREGSERELLYKVLVIGEFGAGVFSDNYKLTIGVDFALKTLQVDEKTTVNLQLWDIAGHERFGHMTRVYYKYAIAAIIVFDISRPATFDSVIKWLKDVHSKVMLANEEPIPVILLANKCDLKEYVINESVLNKFCTENSIIEWFTTSAKLNININKAVMFLVRYILDLPSSTLKQPGRSHIVLNSLLKDDGDDDDFDFEANEKPRHKKCCAL